MALVVIATIAASAAVAATAACKLKKRYDGYKNKIKRCRFFHTFSYF